MTKVVKKVEKGALRIGKILLFALDKVVEGYAYFDDIYHHPNSVFYDYREYNIARSSLRSAIHRLKKKGYVQEQRDQGRLILKLTEAGRDVALKIRAHDESKWDGIWRLVIFDIPESHRKVRDTLRNKLKSWGFEKWQKSTWASKKPLTNTLRQLVKELGIEDWVLVVESTDTGR